MEKQEKQEKEEKSKGMKQWKDGIKKTSHPNGTQKQGKVRVMKR